MIQVKIYDRTNKEEHGGIVTDDGNIICGCCGGLIEKKEISIKNYKGLDVNKGKHFYENNVDKDCETEILQVYDVWLDLSEAIVGES